MRAVRAAAERGVGRRGAGTRAARRVAECSSLAADSGSSMPPPIRSATAARCHCCSRERARTSPSRIGTRTAPTRPSTRSVEEGGRAFTIEADITDEERRPRAWSIEARVGLGGLDGLVLNVGIGAGRARPRGPSTSRTGTRRWRRTCAARCSAAARRCPCSPRAASIVFISSIAGITSGSRLPAYDASKAALGGLMRHVAREGARRGIRANVVAPGLVDTPLGRLATAGRPSREATNVPFGRQATGVGGGLRGALLPLRRERLRDRADPRGGQRSHWPVTRSIAGIDAHAPGLEVLERLRRSPARVFIRNGP